MGVLRGNPFSVELGVGIQSLIYSEETRSGERVGVVVGS
jgi:hypothetical protein